MLEKTCEQFDCKIDIINATGLSNTVHTQLRVTEVLPRRLAIIVALSLALSSHTSVRTPRAAESIGPIVLPQGETRCS